MALSFINTSGNIISEDFCSQLLIETKADYVKSKSFGDDVKKVDEDIATSFELLRERWEEIRSRILEDQFDTTQLRDRWIKPFLSMLGFEPVYISHNLKNDAGIEYHIPYRGWDVEDAPFVHMVHSSADFDLRDKNNRTHANKSPHDMLQQFLNTSQHSWAILINGRKIRILRDFFHSITKGFIEFDIEGIFETANTEQFRILYRMMHSSRFIGQYEKQKKEEEPQICLLEKFHALSRETGVKVGDNLRKQVRIAIETLGNGFAENINPDDFDDAKEKKFYSETLNIIYRLLFLLFAEQKGWLPVKNNIYARTYSINALRERAERADYLHDNNKDLWEGLKVTFRLVTKGYTFPNGESINAFGGQLFSDERIFHIKSPLKNKHLLKAINALCFFEDKKAKLLKTKINYATLAIDELGSVYESLLDYEPRLLKENTEINGRNCKRGEFVLDDRSTERKTTGSYYTDSRLVAQLIDSALVPVIENALKDKNTDEEKRTALLELKVADIACGSGAFLIAALEKMGEYLSLIGKEEGEKPTEQELRHAKREVLQNCIYGVDLNPMALELAKFSLWITASMPNFPLSFLDHKLKSGNSLVGATPELIKKGIPVEAFNPVTLDDKVICTQLKAIVKKELEQAEKEVHESNQLQFAYRDNRLKEQFEEKRKKIMDSLQEDINEVSDIEVEYGKLVRAEHEFKEWLLSDFWTAAFFIKKDNHDLKQYPTNKVLKAIEENEQVDEELVQTVKNLANQYRFFHWHLEYPEVFEKGGFDCILGNPPWEKLQAEEVKFFSTRDTVISTQESTKKRKQLIDRLQLTNPHLFIEWESYKDSIERTAKYIINSSQYKNSGKGNINFYKIFADKAIKSISKKGYCGLIVQSGLFTDDLSKEFFQELMLNMNIVSVYDFDNVNRLFPIHRQMRFSLITLSKEKNEKTKFRFYLTKIEDINSGINPIEISIKDISLINPNTLNCPMVKDNFTFKLLQKLYKIGQPINSPKSEYKYRLWGEMYNMSRGAIFRWDNLNEKMNYVPLYESKYFNQFDHRFAGFNNVDTEDRLKGNTVQLTSNFKANFGEPDFRYFVLSEEVNQKKIKYSLNTNWYVGIRSVTSATNSRTVISTILPPMGVANSVNLLLVDNSEEALSAVFSLNSFVTDFIASTKVGNQNLNIYIIEQIPIIPKSIYKKFDSKLHISDKLLRLIYTSDSLRNFAIDLGYDGEPFSWDDEERFQLKCEMDAIYGHLYGLTRGEFDYILETFPIVKRKDMEKYGTYRTKDTILKLFDEMEWVKDEMEKTKTEKLN